MAAKKSAGNKGSKNEDRVSLRAFASLAAPMRQRSRALYVVPSAGMDAVEFVLTWTNGVRGTLTSLLDNGRQVLDYLPVGDGAVSYRYETFDALDHILEWDLVAPSPMTSLQAFAGVNGAQLKAINTHAGTSRWQDQGVI